MQFNSPEGSFELQNKVSRIYQNQVIGIIDTLLSEYSNPDIIYRIETLEINLGSIDVNNLEQDFLATITTELKQKLVENKNIEIPDEIPQAESLNSESGKSQKKDFPPQNLSYPQKRESSISHPTSTKVEILSYFIQEGRLPWYSENFSKSDLENLFEEIIVDFPEIIKPILLASFQNERQLKRIIYQFSDSILLQIINQSFTGFSVAITEYNSYITEIFKRVDIFQNIPENQLRLESWQGIILSLCNEENNQVTKEEFIQKHLLHITARFNLKYLDLIEQIEQTAVDFQKYNKSFKIPVSKISDPINTPTSINNFSRQDINKIENPLFPAVSNSVNISAHSKFTHSDEIYISNAGLILIWPFLTSFFNNLGFVEQNSFVDQKSGDRAAVLLQYIVERSTEISEHELPLNKLLCGRDLSEPIDTNQKFTEQEQTESEDLLSAVIHNWSILKNTTSDGLRTAFLQREGILKIHNGSWMLQVKRETYDILLDRIPWTIRIIKLPWMDDILSVEW